MSVTACKTITRVKAESIDPNKWSLRCAGANWRTCVKVGREELIRVAEYASEIIINREENDN